MFDKGTQVCLLPRLALSELMALSGLVRHLVGKGLRVMVIAHKDHASAVRCLYGDITDGIRFTFVSGWNHLYSPRGSSSADNLLDSLQAAGHVIVPLDSYRQACPYLALDIDPAEARTGFLLTRALDQERALHQRIVEAVGHAYVVVHDADDRRIRRHLLPAGLPVVDVRDPRWRTPNIFDWVQAVDRAAELHAIDSCFMFMADTLALRARRVLHAYTSPGPGRATYHDTTIIYG